MCMIARDFILLTDFVALFIITINIDELYIM
jgi:hypothetical protein